ncbi:B12-binding domain-containing radical SAM protein [Sanyastnella coralliicola]|uniref:B12-binding domain-containing radical SAM protein n=1 Tax=Sanyastnella coralliicola TaxID=3069118 RepID=UPI0027BA7B61|nr:radical SAM protein [Longitalea sp. SCSIO 12813]
MLLLIPPLTQLNTPYPATAYLKGFLVEQGYSVHQGDLGLDLILELFTKEGLSEIFDQLVELQQTEGLDIEVSEMLRKRRLYENTIETVVGFLQHKHETIAYRIAQRNFLPEGARFQAVTDLEWYFGTNSVQDQARYLCSLYLEDLVDMIGASVGPHLEISKYAERIGRTASSFEPIKEELNFEPNLVDLKLQEMVARYFEKEVHEVVGFTVPFGGNLYGALKCAQWIRQHHPETKIILGGGYANTELRDLSDPQVFDYIDYITLDDGEGPILALLKHLEDPEKHPHLKRTFHRKDGEVVFQDDLIGGDFGHATFPAPDYSGLRMDEYLSMFDMPNPMNRLWNDGRWNKMTIAHGCYWKRCSFCDVTLDYIGRFEEAPASKLVDRMEQVMAQTGESGFHFVDEAAPPLAMRDLAMEILKRGIQVSWWTNIRFEKTFTPDLCRLLAASGCIAVTGGLEVASDRLLALMEKGVTIDQVSRVTKAFSDAGILVHAYLMYGFPTETEQETIDSLEVVRQLFEAKVVQSAFWHQFAMTAHSPVGKDPDKYQVIRTGPEFMGFANNDLYHEDPTGADHEEYGEGLRKALYNYMHDNGLDFPLQEFFDFPIPAPTVPRKRIQKALKQREESILKIPGYRFFQHGVLLTEVGRKKGQVKVEMQGNGRFEEFSLPEEVVLDLNSKWVAMAMHLGEGLEVKATLETWAMMLGISADKILETEWFKALSRNGLWTIRC